MSVRTSPLQHALSQDSARRRNPPRAQPEAGYPTDGSGNSKLISKRRVNSSGSETSKLISHTSRIEMAGRVRKELSLDFDRTLAWRRSRWADSLSRGVPNTCGRSSPMGKDTHGLDSRFLKEESRGSCRGRRRGPNIPKLELRSGGLSMLSLLPEPMNSRNAA